MKSFDKRLLIVSFLVHIVVIFAVNFICTSSRIQKTFVAYGRHSRYQTKAYFRQMQHDGNYRKYFKQAKKKKVHKKKPVKKLARKLAKKPAKKQAKKKVKKKIVKKKKLLAKNNPKKRIKQKPVKHEPVKQEPKMPEEIENEILHFNIMGETDPVMVRYQQQIQEAIDTVWKPPIGVPKGTECHGLFSVDKSGKVIEFKITKQSKVVIYDLSVVRDAKKVPFPKNLWGKTFPVIFRQ